MSWVTLDADEKIRKLRFENETLRAELEARKPKPVVEIKETRVYLGQPNSIVRLDPETPHAKNIKLTFEDGVLVNAEVIGERP